MAIITIFSGSFCHAQEVAELVSQRLAYALFDDERLAQRARDKMAPDKLLRLLTKPPSFFHSFNQEKERGLSYLRAALADVIAGDHIVYSGFAGHLLPWTLPNVLRVCLVANASVREARAGEACGELAKQARRRIRDDDRARDQWTRQLFGFGPWDKRLYDLVLSTATSSPERTAARIVDAAKNPALETTPEAVAMTADLALEAKIGVALIDAGHDVEVSCRQGHARMLIHQRAFRLKRLQKKLQELALSIPGVSSAAAELAPTLCKPHIFVDLELGATRVLLLDSNDNLDDEQEAWLRGRHVQLYRARNAREARALLLLEGLEVVLLDLGPSCPSSRELLRHLRQEHPDTEVIALVNDDEAQPADVRQEHDVFALLPKPIDLDALTETLRQASRKASQASPRAPDPTNQEELSL